VVTLTVFYRTDSTSFGGSHVLRIVPRGVMTVQWIRVNALHVVNSRYSLS